MLDTNGDGRITRPWNQIAARRLVSTRRHGRRRPGGRRRRSARAFDPKLDTLVSFNLYAVIPSPVDDSVWGVSERYPGYLVRLQRGNNPPASLQAAGLQGAGAAASIRAASTSISNGVVWTALAASSHLASFDRRKCKDLSGPAKTDGSQCREGWTLYQTTGPKLKGTDIPADFHYYNWVDQHDIARPGREHADRHRIELRLAARAEPADTEWTTLRVPYPLGFYSRGLDGRIDDPKAGWKGRGALRQLRHALRVAHRGRQGHEGQAGEVPDAPRPAGAVDNTVRRVRFTRTVGRSGIDASWWPPVADRLTSRGAPGTGRSGPGKIGRIFVARCRERRR